jgi:methylase of polypeptide subunit release factors
VLHLLGALQFLEMKVPGGGREKRRLSFRALDIEQIGHVYEGLLDHTACRATELVLGLDGKEQIEVALTELNRRRGQPDFVEWLADETGRSAKAIEKALAQNSVDDPLRWPAWEQVAPFAGLVRRDDNGDPWVIPAGSLYVTVGTARRQTGTQYTPRTLTESVVEHALAPLVYTGPAEGQPPEAWQLKTAGQILDLKICDFACGSAAFLVAAARYLSARLVEAWDAAQREHGAGVQITPYGHASSGLPEEELIPSNPDERGLYALRIVVERCLYGVDRNPLAAEMAKLSLWLLTLQRNRPFTFLDHAIRCGDSLLGVDLRQLSTWSLSGEGKQSVLFDNDLSFAADKREGLMKMQYHPGDQRRLLDAALAKTRRLHAAADRLIATAFEANPEAAAAAISMGLEEQETEARKILEGKRPFHWPVEFPEVFLHGGGFDAIVGNPPFIGGQRITGAFGQPYRDYLVEHIAGGQRGSADYVAYFFLRAEGLLKNGGCAGLLATNSIAQGVTGEVGLDQMVAGGTTLYRAIPSRKWPGEANLEVAHIWFRKGSWFGPFHLDGAVVTGITGQLQAPSGIAGNPNRLAANAGKSFQGSIVLGMGFVLEPDEAKRLLDKDPKNARVVMPYLGGKDITDTLGQLPRRWVINFHDWPLEKAAEYPDCFEIVERLVKPERDKNNRKVYRDEWWHYAEKRPDLYSTIAGLERVLVAVRVSAHHCIGFAPGGIVYADRLVVFALDKCSHFALLASTIHDSWVHRPGSTTHETRNTYFPDRGFETFAFPASINLTESVGQRYYSHRRDLMAVRGEGLTTTYNRFHSPHEVSHDIAALRALHVEMDYAVAAAYDWTDLDLGHGFHQTKQGIRYTISEAARRTVLDRLLALNHERHAQEEAAAGASSKPARKPKARKHAPDQKDLF